jgi:nucleoside 2-deoxyribosyltransferase
MSKKLYVAGCFARAEDINLYIRMLKHSGYEITHDWTKVEISEDYKEKRATYAIFDVEGVRDADTLVIIITEKDYPYMGTSTELGVALGLNKRVVIYDMCPDSRFMKEHLFIHHPNVKIVTTWRELLQQI